MTSMVSRKGLAARFLPLALPPLLFLLPLPLLAARSRQTASTSATATATGRDDDMNVSTHIADRIGEG